MAEGVKVGGLQIPSLLFTDDMVLLASSNRDLQLTLGQFAVECEVAKMRISTFKSEAMVLSQKRVDCPLQAWEELLLRVKVFKYLWVLFTCERKKEQEVNGWIWVASGVMGMLNLSVGVKRKLTLRGRLSIHSRFTFQPSALEIG